MTESQNTPRLRLQPHQRLRRPAEYQLVYDRKCRASDECLLVFAARGTTAVTRLGTSVGKKHGNSVVRHRWKRLLREAFRLEQHLLPSGLDLVVVPRAAEIPALEVLRSSLSRLVRKVAGKLQ